jgi:hypothetical protein
MTSEFGKFVKLKHIKFIRIPESEFPIDLVIQKSVLRSGSGLLGQDPEPMPKNGV